MKTPKHFARTKKEHREARKNPDATESRNRNPLKEEEGNLTADDIDALGPVGLAMDMGEDEQLKHREYPVDFSAVDLDIPGAELDDKSEDIGSEDEENNHYSIGGDNGL
jgi:hypothetical protein